MWMRGGGGVVGGGGVGKGKAGGVGKGKVGGEGGGEVKVVSDFETRLRSKLNQQSAKAAEEADDARPIRGSQQELERRKQSESVPAQMSDRRPFECERCQWSAKATAIRRCRRCNWCEQGSKEEAEVMKQVIIPPPPPLSLSLSTCMYLSIYL